MKKGNKMILNKILLILLFFASVAYSADKDKNAAFDVFLNKWKSAWNSTNEKDIINIIDPNQSYPPKIHKQTTSLVKEYGKIKNITFIKSYDENSVYLTRIEFENKFTFPFLFQFYKNDTSLKLRKFLPGQDPTIKRDDKKTKEFIDKWVEVWNEKSPPKLMRLTHSKSKIKGYLNSIPEEQRNKMIKGMFDGGFEKIKGYKIIGYKQNTNEYIITFNYALKGEVTGAMMIKKDSDDVIKVYNFDVDDGERALQRLNSWQPQ